MVITFLENFGMWVLFLQHPGAKEKKKEFSMKYFFKFLKCFMLIPSKIFLPAYFFRIHKPKTLSLVKLLQHWDSSSDGLPGRGPPKAFLLNPRKQGKCLGKREASLDAVFPLVCTNFSEKWSDLNMSAFSSGNCSVSSFSDVLV